MICDEVGCISFGCTVAIKETRRRVMNQIHQFREITGQKIERECKNDSCNEIVVHPRQYCVKCKEERRTEQKKAYRAKQPKKKIYCRNKDCGKEIVNPKYNSVRYCDDNCRPRKQVTAKTLKEGREPMRKTITKKSYGVDPKFTNPRGSKKRKEMGLEPVKFSNHVSGSHSVVE